MGDLPTVYGAPYSAYVRAVRMVLAEKGVRYRLIPIDVFADTGVPTELLERQPFGRIPAFEHDGFKLYESSAIARYVDEAFPGPALQPSLPQARARMNQLLSILDAYAYRTLVWDIYVERVSKPKENKAPDEERIQAALPKAQTCLSAISEIMGHGPFLAGTDLTLADLHAAPMFAYFTLAPEAAPLLAAQPQLGVWWKRIRERPSLLETTR